uniref:Uncharacterized protein n=1 Tax=Arundo donax TaxID=35708 RepID=A0A0A9B8T4_ARUDO
MTQLLPSLETSKGMVPFTDLEHHISLPLQFHADNPH